MVPRSSGSAIILLSTCLMLGLWSTGTAPICLTLHVAFEMEEINDLLDAPKRLKNEGIIPLSFLRIESMESSVQWIDCAGSHLLSEIPMAT